MRKRITQKVAEAAKPEAKPYRIADTLIQGLTLRVQPSGAKLWKLRTGGTERALGRFPAMTAGMAAEAAKRILSGEDEAHKQAPTLGAFLVDTYLPWTDVHLKGVSQETYRLNALPWKGTRLDALSLGLVEKYRTERLKAGIQKRTINRDLAPLKAALNRAVTWKLIKANPLADLAPFEVDPNGVVRFLETEEEKRLYAALSGEDDWLRTLITLLLNTGARRNEMFGVRWADVDLKRRMVVVRWETAKSGKTRHIPLNQTAVAALKAWRGDDEPDPTLPVLPRREFRKSWVTLLKRARIESFRVHDCRHHFASRLVQAGVPLNDVRELLGHGDLRMTLRYAHLAPANLKSAVDLIG